MLDDRDKIKQLDRSDALGVIAAQPEQLKHTFSIDLPGDWPTPQSIVLAGMGGSALAAEFISNWLWDELPLPINIVRDYQLPAFVNQRTLVICSSYSGNTEEALSALESSAERGAKIICIASGGKLQQIASDKGYPFIEIPGGLQPRLAVLYGVKALTGLLEQLGLVEGKSALLEGLKLGVSEWAPEQNDNLAKQIATKIHGHPAVIYAGPTLGFLAMKWKIDINENGKNVAFYNVYPEFNHNEFIGWSNQGQPFSVVQLRSSLDHPQVQKRFEVSNKLLADKMPHPIAVEAQGKTALEQMLWTFVLGTFVSAYLAILNGVDPTPVELIEQLKQELA